MLTRVHGGGWTPSLWHAHVRAICGAFKTTCAKRTPSQTDSDMALVSQVKVVIQRDDRNKD